MAMKVSFIYPSTDSQVGFSYGIAHTAALHLHERDAEYSRRFCEQDLSHYAIKCNRFMGVISDYFVNEP